MTRLAASAVEGSASGWLLFWGVDAESQPHIQIFELISFRILRQLFAWFEFEVDDGHGS